MEPSKILPRYIHAQETLLHSPRVSAMSRNGLQHHSDVGDTTVGNEEDLARKAATRRLLKDPAEWTEELGSSEIRLQMVGKLDGSAHSFFRKLYTGVEKSTILRAKCYDVEMATNR